MTATRRTAVLCVSMLAVAVAGVGPARAQSSPSPSPSGGASGTDVTLTLLGQSSWNGRDRPLTLALQATNAGVATVRDLSVFLTIGSPARSRSLYEESLTGDPTPAVFTFPFPQAGALAPGGSRTFRIRQAMDIPTIGAESALYPLRVDLRAGDDVLATIRTPMLFLADTPKVPLSVAWTLVLSEPLQFGPDGVLDPGPLEADIAPGGRLAREVGAIDDQHPVAADLAVSPVLLTELQRMAAGYKRRDAAGGVTTVPPGTAGAQDATRLLAALTRVAARPAVEVTAMPFGDASVPATIHGGFRNLPRLLEMGRQVAQDVLGVTASRQIFRPPGSQLDAQSLAQLVQRGVTTVLVDGGFVPAAPTLAFSPPSLTRLTGAGRAATAIVPDQGAEALAIAYRDDPVLAAHAVLGELAARYFELPNAPGRGAALLFPERPFVSAGIFGPLARLLAGSPWLSTVTVTGLVERVTPDPGTTVPVPAHAYHPFDAGYLASMTTARSALADFEATVVGADQLKVTLGQDLLIAQSGSFVTDPRAGQAYIDAVSGTIGRAYRAVVPPSNGSTITLPSQHGVLPITIRNDSPYRIRAQLVLTAAPQLRIDGGATKSIVLPAKASLPLQITVSAATTGRFQMLVQILTPTGVSIVPAPGDQRPYIVVRSTQYNRVALAITAGAVLFLAVWWGRRFLPRRTS